MLVSIYLAPNTRIPQSQKNVLNVEDAIMDKSQVLTGGPETFAKSKSFFVEFYMLILNMRTHQSVL